MTVNRLENNLDIQIGPDIPDWTPKSDEFLEGVKATGRQWARESAKGSEIRRLAVLYYRFGMEASGHSRYGFVNIGHWLCTIMSGDAQFKMDHMDRHPVFTKYGITLDDMKDIMYPLAFVEGVLDVWEEMDLNPKDGVDMVEKTSGLPVIADPLI